MFASNSRSSDFFSDNFGDNAESLGSAIEFILLVNKAASDTQIFESAPDISTLNYQFSKIRLKRLEKQKAYLDIFFLEVNLKQSKVLLIH